MPRGLKGAHEKLQSPPTFLTRSFRTSNHRKELLSGYGTVAMKGSTPPNRRFVSSEPLVEISSCNRRSGESQCRMRFSDDTHHYRRTEQYDNGKKGDESLYHREISKGCLSGTVARYDPSVRTDFQRSMLGEGAFFRALFRREVDERSVLPRILRLEKLIAPLKTERGYLLSDKP